MSAGQEMSAGDPLDAVRLAEECLARYENTGERADLASADGLARAAVARIPDDNPELANALSVASTVARACYQVDGRVSDLDRAERYARAVLPAGPGAAANLVAVLLDRYERTADPDVLVEAETTARSAVAATAAGDAALATRLTNLGLVLYASAQFAEAVRLTRTALDATPTDDPERPGRLSNLAELLRGAAEHEDHDGWRNEAVEFATAAVEATPAGHVDADARLTNLALARLGRYERHGAVGDLTEAVRAARAAVTASPTESPNRPSRLANLALAVLGEFEATGSPTLLDEAVTAAREAVDTLPPGHADTMMVGVDAGVVLARRYDVTGDIADIEEAVDHCRLAGRGPVTHVRHRAAVMANLAGALTTFALRTEDVDTLAEAIDTAATAVAGTVVGDPVRPVLHGVLANALTIRYLLTGAPESITEAIAAFQTAADETPAGHPDRPSRLANLGTAQRIRHERVYDPESLAASVANARAAVELVDDGDATPNGCVLWQVLGEALETAAGLPGSGNTFADAAVAFRRAALNEAGTPYVRARSATSWGRLAAILERPGEAHTAFRTAVDLLDLAIAASLGRPDQEYRLAVFAGMASDAAACAALDGAADSAYELIERARGVLLARAVDLRPDLADVAEDRPDLAEEFTALCVALDHLPEPDVLTPRVPRHATQVREVAEHRARLRDRLAAVTAEIRVAGHPEFRAAGVVPAAVAADGPLVMVNASPYFPHALIVTAGPQAVRVLPLPDLEASDAQTQVGRFMSGLAGLNRPGQRAGNAALTETLEWLWDTIARPVLEDGLDVHGPPRDHVWPRVWWCATGSLAFLPLHAAGRPPTADDPYPSVLDRVVSSYTPSARALAHVRRSRPPGRVRAVVVAEPLTPGAVALPGAAIEAGLVRAAFPDATVLTDATPERVADEMGRHTWAHFGCHSRGDAVRPSAGALLVGGGQLSIREIGRARTDGGEVAVLSSCRTATPAAALIDESVHLAGAFLLAGYRHVAATLWPVADRHATTVASAIYRAAAAAERPADVLPHALHHAARDLRAQWRDWPSVWAGHVHFGA